MKKLKFPTSKKLWIPLLVLVLTVQALLLALVGYRVDILWIQHEIDSQMPLSTDIQQQIRNANSSLYDDVVVDIQKDRVYIPEARLSLPLNENTQRLVYSTTKSESGNTEEINFSTKSILNSYLRSFEEVPCLQRFVAVSIGGNSQWNWSDDTPAETIELDDGTKLAIYKNSYSACVDFWGQITPDMIVDALKQTERY